MTQRDEYLAVRHMRDHAAEAVAMVAGRTRTDLDRERILELALTRLVELVGESAMRVSPPVRESLPAVPWRQIIGTRNRLIHGYDSIDRDVLWQVIVHDLPPLVEMLTAALGEAPPGGSECARGKV